jgi:hypothetical protein
MEQFLRTQKYTAVILMQRRNIIYIKDLFKTSKANITMTDFTNALKDIQNRKLFKKSLKIFK